jgi:hypothetical protein
MGSIVYNHLKPSTVRYIKLGPSGAWLRNCLDTGVLALGYKDVPHSLAAEGRWAEAEQLYVDAGRSAGKAKSFVREVRDFYTLGDDCLWITIGQGRLWWAFAQPAVRPNPGEMGPSRTRAIIGGWSDRALTGEVLDVSTLSTRLTKVAAYQQTICSVGDADYLLRRINGTAEPAIERATVARAELIGSTEALIQRLDWSDFELLVDLIFSASGWRRVSAVGGSAQADTDLILEQVASGERAFVQVKSSASPHVLADYVERFRSAGTFSRMFFICHSPKGAFSEVVERGVEVWLLADVASRVVRAGLFDWLLERVR